MSASMASSERISPLSVVAGIPSPPLPMAMVCGTVRSAPSITCAGGPDRAAGHAGADAAAAAAPLGPSVLAAISVSEGKARTAVGFRRPSKAIDDAIAGGGAALRLLSIQGEGVFVQGGLPIVVDGKVVGAIGASGGASQQDEQVARAGLNALK